MARKASYVPTPAVPEALMQRLLVVVEVLSGMKTVSEGARVLGLSRNHFQTVLHRGLDGLIQGLDLKPAGRRARSPAQQAQAREQKRLARENARLRKQVAATEQLLTLAGGLLKGRARPTRAKRTTKVHRDDGGDADPDPTRRLEEVEAMRALGVTARLTAAVAGVHPATVRRWRARRAPATAPAAPNHAVPPTVAAQATAVVRALQGQIGAVALQHAVPGLSRRQAAWLKGVTRTRLERERKAALTRIQVTQPGVLRAMDGVHYRGAEGPFWALIAADGAVPYRTSVTAGTHYDEALVVRALERDLARNGAPLVYRLDRAKAHDAPRARAVLAAHEVLVLHGPPRCPRYYGQLERQNREHRAWDAVVRTTPSDEIEARLQEMLNAVNSAWPRRMLAWRTTQQAWDARPALDVDRRALRDEVNERAARIARTLAVRGQPADLAERLAIEQALETRGYLRRLPGGWC
jgi:hypothetical protein